MYLQQGRPVFQAQIYVLKSKELLAANNRAASGLTFIEKNGRTVGKVGYAF